LNSLADTDRELVARIERGERTAEAELVRRFGQAVKLILFKRTGKAHLVNDLVQDTFVVALRRLRAGEMRNPGALSAFIRQIAVNVSIEHFRREKRFVPQSDEIISIYVTHRDYKAKLLDTPRLRALLENALNQLSMPRDREMLRRFYLLDEDKEWICSDLGLSATHFDRVLYRAKQRMRELIDQDNALKSLLFGGIFDE